MEEELKVPFSAPLNKLDTEAQTYGCRANNSDFWANNFIQDVCVFNSKGYIIWRKPSRAWRKQLQVVLILLQIVNS